MGPTGERRRTPATGPTGSTPGAIRAGRPTGGRSRAVGRAPRRPDRPGLPLGARASASSAASTGGSAGLRARSCWSPRLGRDRSRDSSPDRPTWRGLYRSFLVRDGSWQAASAAAGRLLTGWRRALETLGHGVRGQPASGGGRAAGGRGRPGLAGTRHRRAPGRRLPRRGRSPRLRRRPRGGRRRQRRRRSRSTERAGFADASSASSSTPAPSRSSCSGSADRSLPSPGRARAMSGPSIALVALAVALVVTPVAIVVARRTGIVDRPGALKPQTAPVPYLGGVAVFAGTVVGVVAGRPTWSCRWPRRCASASPTTGSTCRRSSGWSARWPSG